MNDKNDPIGKYLGEKLAKIREPDPRRREPPWRPSPVKIASWCAALIIVAAGGYLVCTRTGSGPGMTIEHARVVPGEQVEQERAAGLVTLVKGEVALVRGDERSQPGVGDAIRAGDVLETASEASVGIEHAGHTVVLMERARLSVRSAPASELRVSLERGVLAARSSRNEGALRIEGRNADVVSRGAVFTVKAAGNVLEKTSVAQGEVEVLSKEDRKDVHIARSSFLDMHTWTASAGAPEKQAIEELVDLTGIELPAPVEIVPDAGVAADAPPAANGCRSPTVEEKVREALDGGDVQKAIVLIESEGQSITSPDFLLMAGDTYRQAGKWSEAAEAYLSAGGVGGKKAERALIKAAEIHFRQLSDAGEAARILDGYFEKFPEGSYLDEALYLDGAVHTKLGQYAEASKHFERYLELYPDGLQVVRVHLSLAQILASKLSDCPGAMSHVKAIPKKSMAPPVAAKVQKVQKLCGAK